MTDVPEALAAAVADAKSNLAASTWRAYESDWGIFIAWCQAMNLTALPATPSTVVMFISIAAHQAERLRLEERNQSAESRWLTEEDRVRQNAKEQERHIKEFKRQVTQLQSERDTLRQEIQGARAELKTAAAVREQLEMRLRTAGVSRPNVCVLRG